MKLKRCAIISLLVLTLSIGSILSGCSKGEGGTIDEPDLTTEYLIGEYKDQIVRDGAKMVTGSIKIEKKKDKTRQLKIESKVVVENEDYEKGYYIADKNHLITAWIDEDTRATYISGSDEPKSISIDELAKKAEENGKSKDVQLYDIYLMGDQASLILAKDLK